MSSPTPLAPALELRGIRRIFKQAGTELVVLNGVDLVLRPGEVVALVGPSGAGKSTLLHIAGLLERPDGGAVVIGGEDCGSLNDERRTMLRRSEIGFVYQFHHLLPEFSALENVMLPQMIAMAPRRQAREKAAALLERVGLMPRAGHRPARLSGGEQQRVAIARALANEPRLLLADEPTGAVDSVTSQRVLDLLDEARARRGMTLIVVSYDPQVGASADRMVTVTDGVLMLPETDLSAAPSA